MRGHVRRFKAVLLDWLPRRVDPLAFYHWRHPWQNVLVLWVISHVCLWPSQWLFGMTLLVTLTLLRRIAIQVTNRGEATTKQNIAQLKTAYKCHKPTSNMSHVCHV